MEITNKEKQENVILEGEVIKAGRPSTYKPEFIEKMLDAMEQGASDTKVMKILGICRDTFYRWLKEHDDFKEAHEYGKTFVEVHWDNVVEYGIMNPKAVNGTLLVAYLKKRDKKWRDSSTPEGVQGNHIQIGNLNVNNIGTLTSNQLEDEIQKRLETLNAADPTLLTKLLQKKEE